MSDSDQQQVSEQAASRGQVFKVEYGQLPLEVNRAGTQATAPSRVDAPVWRSRPV